MNYLYDAALIVIILSCIVISRRKGFISSSRNILSLILTAVLLTYMMPAVLGFIQMSPIKGMVKEMVSENITKSYEREDIPKDTVTSDKEGTKDVFEKLSLPLFIESGVKSNIAGMTEVKNSVMSVITESITLMILKVLAMILIFFMVKLLVFLLLKILDTLFKIPGLKQINRFLGMLLGIVNSLLLIYAICGAIAVFAPAEKLPLIEQTINSTYLVKYFYENNILLSLFI